MASEKVTVFVFGSNGQGFHGAGSAGYAMRGNSSNNWRSDEAFLRAIDAPVGSPDRVGKLAVFGIARGIQKGREGWSYAIQTVTRPGHKRSISLADIKQQFVELWQFAKRHSKADYLLTPLGCGYAGYKPEEMLEVLSSVIAEHGKLDNIIIPEGLYSGQVSSSNT